MFDFLHLCAHRRAPHQREPSRPGWWAITIASLVTLSAASTATAAQQPIRLTAASVIGTYGLGTRQPPSPRRDGCWLEVAPVPTDSVHLQMRCSTASPSHHLGVLDLHLPFRGGSVAYETDQYASHCRIAVSFARARARVTQEGNAAACGFGANVDVGGTYRRISSRPPRFDLAPLERRRLQRK
jgi:hypothetical protein